MILKAVKGFSVLTILVVFLVMQSQINEIKQNKKKTPNAGYSTCETSIYLSLGRNEISRNLTVEVKIAERNPLRLITSQRTVNTQQLFS